MSDVYTVTCPRNDNVFIHLMAGHFISSSNHINYYIGTSDVKHNHAVSVDTAMLLSEYYNTNDISVDTVLCLYETQAQEQEKLRHHYRQKKTQKEVL